MNFANKHMNNVISPTFSGPGALATRKEVEQGEWEDEIRQMADRIKSRPAPGPARGRPSWDPVLECWVTVPAKADDSLMKDYLALRAHPMFGFIVQPAKAAHPEGWLEPEVFLTLVRQEYVELKKMMLKEKFK